MNPVTASDDDIINVLERHLALDILGDGQLIDPEQNLLLDGAVDSLGMLKLVAFIEHNYNVKVPPEHFTIENFRNLRVIGEYVRALLVS
jgi:acyl carrier protein